MVHTEKGLEVRGWKLGLFHSALGSSDMWLTELILCVLAVTLHKTVVFDWIKI